MESEVLAETSPVTTLFFFFFILFLAGTGTLGMSKGGSEVSAEAPSVAALFFFFLLFFTGTETLGMSKGGSDVVVLFSIAARDCPVVLS